MLTTIGIALDDIYLLKTRVSILVDGNFHASCFVHSKMNLI